MTNKDYIDRLKQALEKAERNYKRTRESEYRDEIRHYKELLKEVLKVTKGGNV
jgi:uncharacterized protein YaaR (DUF327 family)